MVVIVGSLNMDLVISAPYCPQGGETLTGSGFLTNAGGKGANQAAAAGKLGGCVRMCGCVGKDEFGARLKDSLRTANVDVSCVRSVEGVSTGIAVILVTKGENRIVLDRGANEYLTHEDIDCVLDCAVPGDIYLTQLENPAEVIGYGLRRAKEKGLFTILNPAPANREITPYFPYVDLLTPNESELKLFGGLEELFSQGVTNVITTLGKDGYEIANGQERRRYSCIEVKVRDTTAAGDTLCGGLAVALAEGKTLRQAVAFGSKAASIACTRKGAAQSIPTRREVETFVSD